MANHASAVYQCQSAEKAVLMTKRALIQLGWNCKSMSPELIVAHIPISLWSWGELVRIQINPNGLIQIESKCTYEFTLVDWGKNQQNINNLLLVISAQEDAL